MIGRIEKFLSHRFFPALDANGLGLVSHAENTAGINNALHIAKVFRPGFYMLECRFCNDVTGKVARFSPAQSETSSAAIMPFQVGRLIKRIIHIACPVEGWQLSVLDESGELIALSKQDCEHLRLVPLRKTFASKRMLRRLNQSKAAIKQQAKKQQRPFLDELYALYDRSFNQSRHEHYQRWIDLVESKQAEAALNYPVSPKQQAAYTIGTVHCAPSHQITDAARAVLLAALDDNPEAQLVYADEDQLDALGARKNPYFKPDWNPDLFLAQDYISACYACRDDWYVRHQATFERLGPRLALTALLPTMKAVDILHIPRVLSHKVAVETDEIQQPEWAQRRIGVLQSLMPVGTQLEQGLVMGSVRVKYAVPAPTPLVSLLIPTRDGLEVLQPCVESILEKTSYANYEILILDNQSEKPETLSWLTSVASDERVRVLPYNKPFNYSAINNFGAEQANGSVIGLINNDVEVIAANWLTEMVAQALRPDIGCVGAKLYYGNGQIQHAGVILGLGGVAGHAHRFFGHNEAGYHGRLQLVQSYSAVTAACLLVRREIFEAVGGLEEEHLTVAYNDVDFCIRVREMGYRNLWTPYAELYHHESISRGEDDTPVKKARYDKEVAYMQEVWQTLLEEDPCYNPNLCRRREDFSLPDVLF